MIPMISVLLLMLMGSSQEVPVQSACATPEYAALDFWIGRWRVEDANGQPIGSSTVSRALDGCAVREEWRSDEVAGSSITAYDAATRLWHQMWVDDSGTVLHLRGAANDSGIILTGARTGRDGTSRMYRMKLSPADAAVKQVFDASEDGGDTWNAFFTGIYRREGNEDNGGRI